jgi:ABC-2 type transport system ATP-binding protein
MTEHAVLAIKGLSKSYHSGLRSRIDVLRGMSLVVGKSEVYGLLGRNGAGKSTTFRLLMGLSRMSGGEISILDGRPGEKNVQLLVGYCPENPQFPPNLKVVELMRFHSALVAERILTPGNRIDWLLTQFDLNHYRDSQMRILSRGTVQRVALALALLGRPKLLVLDEPLTALDPLARKSVLGILGDQKLAGTSMIISSHILSDLENVADRLGILSGGAIEKEFDLAAGALDMSQAMEIRVPLESGKKIMLDEPALAGIQEGESFRFPELSYEKAQSLLKRWSTSGIDILEVQRSKAMLEAEVLASLAEDRPEPGPLVKQKTAEELS